MIRNGREVSRIEGFSDAVFGFALTLLVVSLEVPDNFEALKEILRGFIPFAATFALVCWIWFEHYAFFRKFDAGGWLGVSGVGADGPDHVDLDRRRHLCVSGAAALSQRRAYRAGTREAFSVIERQRAIALPSSTPVRR